MKRSQIISLKHIEAFSLAVFLTVTPLAEYAMTGSIVYASETEDVPAAGPAAAESAAAEAPSAEPAAADAGPEQGVQAAVSAQTAPVPVEAPQVNAGGENAAANAETTAAEQAEETVPAAERKDEEVSSAEQKDEEVASAEQKDEEVPAAEQTGTEVRDSEQADDRTAEIRLPEEKSGAAEKSPDIAGADTAEESTAAAVPCADAAPSDSGTAAAPAGTAGLLQQLIREKLAGVSSASKELVITLLKQNVYEGDVSIGQTAGMDVPESSDFVLKLVAEDAATEEGAEYNGEGSGSAVIGGSLNIKGINVLLQGVGMAVGKKVTVENAELTYKGGKENDTLDVELGDMAKADIRTYDGNDKVTINTKEGAISAAVDTGEGDDTATLNHESGTADITTGGGADTVTIDIKEAAGKVKVDTGADRDRVTVSTPVHQEVEISTGAAEDTVSLNIRKADGGSGVKPMTVQTGEGDDEVKVYNDVNPADERAADESTLEIDLGEGRDRVDLDTSVANTNTKVKVEGGDDAEGDRVHVTGTLYKDASEDDRITAIAEDTDGYQGVKMIADHDQALSLIYRRLNYLTDELKNKKTIKISTVEDNVYKITSLPNNFTDYVLDLTKAHGDKINVSAYRAQDESAAMSNVVIEGSGDQSLTIGKIDAEGRTVVIRAGNVNSIDVQNRQDSMIKSTELKFTDTVKARFLIADVTSKLKVDVDKIVNTYEYFIPQAGRTASVIVGENAKIYTDADIDLKASVEQTGPLISFLSASDMEKYDIANVRIGTADVTVKNGAKMYAGYDVYGDKEKDENNRYYGSVNLSAQTVTTAESGSSGKAPVAVAVALNDAEVNVEEDAEITADANINFTASSKMKVNALTGAVSTVLPTAVAVNVLSNKAKTTVNGKLTAGGMIRVRAEGTTDSAVSASRGDKTNPSGGYIGVDVALQDVQAMIGPKAVVKSGGDLTVESVADEKVNTQVTAGESVVKADNANANTTVADSTRLLRKTVSRIRESLTKKIGDSSIKDTVKNGLKSDIEPLFDTVEKLVEVPVSLDVDPDSEEHGEVRVVSNSETDAVTGSDVQVVQVTVTPGEGYRVSRVWYSYIDNKDGAAADYTVGEAELKDGTWQFVEPAFAAAIHVDYEEIPQGNADNNNNEDGQNNEGPDAGAGNDGDGFEGMFDENERQPDISLNDAMKAAASAESVDGNEKASENQGSSEDASGSQEQAVCREFRILPTESRNENGAAAGSILTGTFDSTTGKCITKAAAGDKIVFVINPADGYTLSEDGLVVRYRTAADGSEIEKIISADADGNYAFTVSDGILENAYTDAGGNAYAFQVVSRFEKIGQEDQKNDPGKNKDAVSQSAAALAVTVAGNRNKASIADGAQVSSEDVTISAKENTVVKNDADGNPADPESVPSADQDDRMRSIVNAVSTEDYLDVIYSATTAKEGDIITVTAKVKNERADAYGLEEVLALSWNDSNGQAHTKEVKYNEDGEASFAMPGVKKGESLKVAVHYGPKDVPVSLDTPKSQNISLAVRRANVGESIVLKLSDEDEQSGKKIKSAVITYTDSSRHDVTKTVDVEKGKLVIPEDALKRTDAGGSFASVTVKSVEIVDKDVAIDWSCTPPDEDTLRITTARMDLDETIPVAVQPKDGYTLKEGTAEFTIGGKNYEVSIRKDDDGKYYVKLPQEVTLSSFGTGPKQFSVNLKGTFEKAAEKKDPDSKNSVGAGVAVNVVNTDNTAEISGGTISAGSVTVRADAVNHVGTTAKAGFGDGGDPGIGGAVAVQVSGLDNAALVKKGTDGSITANSLVVNADGTYRTELTADAAGKGEGPDAGTGSGIGVSVNSARTKAGIQDGVKLTAKDDLSEITVKAVTNAGDRLTAGAGAAAGTAAVPVMAADVADAGAKAYAGRITDADGSALKAGKVTVDAVNRAVHTVTADASAAGKGVARGGAFDIAVVKDSALAELRASVDGADNVTVRAKSWDQVTSTAAAGASGGTKGKAKSNGSEGSTDRQVDKILGGAGNLAEKNGNADTMNAAKDRQKAQTSEGIVAGAAATVVNVAGNSAIARVADGADMNNVKAISITSENRTHADVKADAGTAGSDAGSGAGVAVNVVNIDNKAKLGNGRVTGVGSLNIAALMPESGKVKADTIKDEKAADDRDMLAQRLSASVSEKINTVLNTLDEENPSAGAAVTRTFTEGYTDYVLKASGMEDLVDPATFETKVDGARTDIRGILEGIEDLPEILKSELKSAFASIRQKVPGTRDTYNAAGVSKTTWNNKVDTVISEVTAQYTDKLNKAARTVTVKARNSVTSDLFDIINGKLAASGNVPDAEKLQKNLENHIKGAVDSLREQTVDEAVKSLRLLLPEMTDVEETKVRDSIKAAVDATADTGYMASGIASKFKEKIFDYEESCKKIEKENFDSEAKEILKESFEKAEVDVDDAALEDLLDSLDLSLTPEDTTGKHVISTEAISGSGAGNAGAAGSVAITVLNSNTEAVIADSAGNPDVDVAGGLVMDAREGRRVTSVASAAVGENNRADTNREAASCDAGTGDGNAGSQPAGNLHKVAETPTVKMKEENTADPDAQTAPADAVSIRVNGREKKNGEDLQANAGDKVLIVFDKTRAEGLIIDSISYRTGSGEEGPEVKVLTRRFSNNEEEVYEFNMPDEDVTGYEVVFKKADNSGNETQDKNGKSVGAGASFSMIYGSSNVSTGSGSRSLKAGSLYMNAESDHVDRVAAVGGSDPLAGAGLNSEDDPAGDFALDAAAAVNMLDNSVKTQLENAETIGRDGRVEKVSSRAPEMNRGEIRVTAHENALSDTRASSYEVGSASAVGAAAAVNIARSEVEASVTGNIRAAANVFIDAGSQSTDKTAAYATAKGVDLERVRNRSTDNSKNQTASNINKRLNDINNKKPAEDQGDASDNSLSLSANAVRTLNVSIPDTSEADAAQQEAEDAASDGLEKTLTGSDNGKSGTDKDKNKIRNAAAIGVTVAGHSVKSTADGDVTAGDDIRITAENSGNFSTLGSSAPVSPAKSENSVAAAAAVSFNANTAEVEAGGNLKANGYGDGGDILFASELTQNADGWFRTRLAAQAAAGAVSGADPAASAAVAVAESAAKSTVNVKGGTDDGSRQKLEARKVSISAVDKIKLAARAGGAGNSGDAADTGLSAADLRSRNTVSANVGDYTEVEAMRLDVTAEKKAVSMRDFTVQPLAKALAADPSDLSDAERESADTGIISLKKGNDDKNYTVDVNLSSEELAGSSDLPGFLASVGYYAEADSGAGSAAVTDIANTVSSTLGDHVKVNLIRQDAAGTGLNGDMNVTAASESNARLIAGELSAAPAKGSAGMAIALVTDRDDVEASTGSHAEITTAGSFRQNAKADGDIQLFTAAAAAENGSGSSPASGGARNVISRKSAAVSTLKDDAAIHSAGEMEISSDVDGDLLVLSLGAAGNKGKTAAGGTVNVVSDKAQSLTNIGKRSSLYAENDMTIRSGLADKLISGSASGSAARGGASAAGVISALIAGSRSNVDIAQGMKLRSGSGSVKVLADSDTGMVNVILPEAGGEKAAVGAAAGVNIYNREAKVNLAGKKTLSADNDIEAGQNVSIQSRAKDLTVTAGLAPAGSGDSAAVSGNMQLLAGNSRIGTAISDGLRIMAGNDAIIESDYDDLAVEAAGSIADAKSSAGAGPALAVLKKSNKVETNAGTSHISGYSRTKGSLASDTGIAGGVYVGAAAKETIFLGNAGAADVPEAAGTVVQVINNNTVVSDASAAVLNADNGGKASGGAAEAGVCVRAKDDTAQTILAGGADVSSARGTGASVVTQSSGKTVEARGGNIRAEKDVVIRADNADTSTLVSVSADPVKNAAAAAGAAIQVMKNTVHATLDGEVTSHNGSFSLRADSNTALRNAEAAVGADGKAGVTPEAAVTYFEEDVMAKMLSGSGVTLHAAEGQRADVAADSARDIGIYSVGSAGDGQAGVSGSVNLILSGKDKDKVQAVVEPTALFDLNNSDLDIRADSNYKLNAASAAAASAGKAVPAVNAVVSILKTGTEALMQGNALTKGSASVKANAGLDVVNAGASGDLAGTGSAGASVTALVTGDRMPQDAADMLSYGNSKSEEEKQTTFDMGTFLKTAQRLGAGTDGLSGLARELDGSGYYDSRQSVGSIKDNGEFGFDAASGIKESGADDGSNETDSETLRGQNGKLEESGDIEAAGNIGADCGNSEESGDYVRALIADTSAITAHDVSVVATQDTGADLTAGASGVGASAVVLHSDVKAGSEGTLIIDGGSLTVKAKSGSSKAGSGSDADPAIRSIGLAAAGSDTAGIGVAVSAVRLDNNTEASLDGKVTSAQSVNVQADSTYDNVLAAVTGADEGTVGAGASVAAVQSQGGLTAKIAGGADIAAAADSTLSVNTNSVFNVNAMAAALADGHAGSNSGLAIAMNNQNQNTYIERGASIKQSGGGDVAVKGTSLNTANARILGLSAGGAAIGLNGAVSIIKPAVHTSIGVKGSGVVTLEAPESDITVQNDVKGSAVTDVRTLTPGGAAMNGNALLIFNETDAEAKAANLKSAQGIANMTIRSDVSADAKSEVTGDGVGGLNAGISVNYADLNSKNSALLDTSNLDAVFGSLSVQTGAGGQITRAQANTVTGALGGLQDGQNTAIAWNRAKNTAGISGTKKLTVKDTLTLSGSGTADAAAEMTGMDIGALPAAASAVVAMNQAENSVTLDLPEFDAGRLDMRSDLTADTLAKIKTGGGSLIRKQDSLAAAYGDTKSTLKLTNNGEKSSFIRGDMDMYNTVKDTVKTEVANAGFGTIGASGITGLAYARDDVSTLLEKQDNAPAGQENRLQIDGHGIMKTYYTSAADADVTPSAGGGTADTAADTASAGTFGKAVTQVSLAGQEAQGNGIQAEGDFTIRTVGNIHAGAAVNTPDKAVNVKALPVSQAAAVNEAELLAGVNITGAGRIESGRDVRILSDAERSEAVAAVGGSTSGKKKVTSGEEDVNSAAAREALKNTVELVLQDPVGRGNEENETASGIVAGRGVEMRAAMMDNDESAARSRAEARTLGAESDSLLTAGSMEARSYLKEDFLARISGDDILVRARGGDIKVQTMTDGDSIAGSASPGSLSGAGTSGSRAEAHVGTSEADEERQSSQIILTGKNITLDAAGESAAAEPADEASGKQEDVLNLQGGAVKLEAVNQASASAGMESSPYNLAEADSAAVPTESYLLTQVKLGDRTNLLSGDGVAISSVDRTKASSIADSDTTGLAFNFDSTRGENTVNTRNVIDLGTYAKLEAAGPADPENNPGGGISITAASDTNMNAQTINNQGIVGGLGGSSLSAVNNLDRSVTVNLGSAAIEAAGGSLGIAAISGEDDYMNAEAKLKAFDRLDVTNAEAANNRTVHAAVHFGGEENFRSAGLMDIQAKLGSPTVNSYAGTDAGSTFDGAAAYAGNNHNETAVVSVGSESGTENEDQKPEDQKPEEASGSGTGEGGTENGNRKIELESTGNDIRIQALADTVSSHTNASADGAVMTADAYANMDYNVKANVDISDAELTAAKGAIYLITQGRNAGITLESEAKASGAEAEANAHMSFSHDLSSSITSQKPDTVTFNAPTVVHEADKLLEIKGDRTHPAEVTMRGAADASGSTAVEKKYLSHEAAEGKGRDKQFYQYVYCVFCKDEHAPDEHTDDLLQPWQNGQAVLTAAPGKTLQASLSSGVTNDSRAASEALFVLDLAVILQKDVRLGQDELAKYLLWNNTATQRDEYLLPNSAHLSVGAGKKLSFVTDVLEGEILNDGRVHKVNMISALNEAAVNDPVIETGRNSTLNFNTDTLSLGSDTSLELYLEEVSGSWLKEQFENGTMKALAEQSDDIAAAAGGEQLEGLKEGTGRDGQKLYWFGRAPEDAEDGDAPLYFMTLDEDTDEVKAFRTTAAASEAGEEAAAVSLIVFRDEKADRMGEVQYDVMFRDLSEEEDRALFNAHTLVPGQDAQLEIPAALAIVLRDFSPFFEGAQWPVYKVSDELFFMSDVTDGTGLLFAPDYTVYFDGSTFDSTLTKIEGIDTGDCTVTVKSDQPVWAEWDTENTAHDIGGRSYVLNDNAWEEAGPASQAAAA